MSKQNIEESVGQAGFGCGTKAGFQEEVTATRARFLPTLRWHRSHFESLTDSDWFEDDAAHRPHGRSH